MHKAENKSNKVVVLATYGVAVLCLVLGLVLPLFNGKEVLALKLGDVFKSLLKKDSVFGLANPIALFGIGKSFDITALLIVLYTVVTALAVLAVIPVALSVRKDGKLAKKLYYGIEITAVIVISLYFVSVISEYGFVFKDAIGYNLVIAGIGTMIALLALTGLDKGKKATVKIVLSVLSLIAFLALIDILSLKISEEKLAKLYDKKLATGLSSGGSGIDYINAFFATKLTDTLKLFTGKDKILYLVSAITSTVVLLNFIIDTIKLAVRKYKKPSIIFDIVRYGVEIVLAVLVLVVTLICKHYIGLMLIAILVASATQLTIVIVKYVSALRKKAARRTVKEDEIAVEDTYAYKAAEPILLADGSETVVENPYNAPADELLSDEQPAFEEVAEETAETQAVPESEPATPIPPVPDEDGYVDPELDAKYQQQLLETKEVEQVAAGELDDEDLEDVELYNDPDTTYLTDTEEADEKVAEEEPVEEVAEAEPVEDVESAEDVEEVAEVGVEAIEEPAEAEPVEEVAEAEPVEDVESVEDVEEVAEAEPVEEVAETEPVEEIDSVEDIEEVAEVGVEAIEEPAEAEPVEEVIEEPAEPVEEPAKSEDDGLEEPVQNPFREVKPYNPYERHNNPFKQFEEPPQPYNPYRQQQPVQYEKPQPRPAYEPRKFEQPERPVRPLQPRPIIQEFKPVPPVSEQPPKDTRIYTIDTLYAGPIDDFIRKLSNEERIEFAKTFLEKNRGSLGSIPDYVVGGDNKKFFSATFIYLGRIRGMVSDGLLNKMYKEINLL